MKKVAVTTDSTCASAELAKEFDIGIIPYPVLIDAINSEADNLYQHQHHQYGYDYHAVNEVVKYRIRNRI